MTQVPALLVDSNEITNTSQDISTYLLNQSLFLVFRQLTIDLIKKLDRSCDFDVDIIGWQCGTQGSGPCIPLLHVCDTFPQCFPDNSDETEGCNLYFGGEFRIYLSESNMYVK